MENKTFGIASFAILIEAIITYFNQFFCARKFLLANAIQHSFGHRNRGRL